jgi:hypothetical protein
MIVVIFVQTCFVFQYKKYWLRNYKKITNQMQHDYYRMELFIPVELTEWFLHTFCVTASQNWTVSLFKQEEIMFSTAKCHSQALECNRQRTLTGHLQRSAQEQEVSQQLVDATHQMCKTSLQLRPSSGSVWSVAPMAHTQADPRANSEEAWEPNLVDHKQMRM